MPNIGRYKVKRKLGAGNQGTVYLCTDPELQRQVAIKLLDRSLNRSSDNVRDFLREARAISGIQHPNIVSIFDVGREQGRPYLVFELVDGELLSDRLKRATPELHDALDIFTGMLSGVDQVHQKGIVHRDIKPSNTILNAEGMPKIMDFGIARILTPGSSNDEVLTGTPRYMAPEYIARGEVNAQADVFALGAILYELLTGSHAFTGKDQHTLLQNIQELQVPPPSAVNPEIGEQLDALVLKALEKEPSKRFSNAGEMLTALLKYREAIDEVRDGGATKGTVEFLLRRMQHKSDFPALSESIRTLNRLSSSDDENIDRLAGIIVRDFALTSKILRVVNSAYYSRFAGKIGTITRAIVVLGVRTVRSVAASLIFFEHLHNKTQATRLKNEIASAIFSATLAKQAAVDAKMEHVEESFLCGMLHNLGRILVTYYLHDESEEVERLVKQEGMPQEKAEHLVLGMTFQQVGVNIAKQWNFPQTITEGMVKVDPAAPGDLSKSDVKLRLIANFSNEASKIIGELDDDDNSSVDKLVKRYRNSLAITGRRFDHMVKEARQEFGEFSGSLGRNAENDSFIQRLVKGSASEESVEDESGEKQDFTQTLVLEADSDPFIEPAMGEAVPEQPAINAEVVLTEGLQEVTGMLLDERVNLNQIFNVVLETIYRAMAFQRVTLCLQDAGGKQISAKLGFGEGVEDFMSGFHFPIRYQATVFHAALKNGADLYIADTHESNIKKDIPDWYRKISKAGSFFVFPLILRQRPLGLIYADHQTPQGVALTSKQLNLIKALRNQIILAFKTRM